MTWATVIALFNKTHYAVQPWIDAGATVYMFDLLHDGYEQDGNVYRIKADLDPGASGWLAVESAMRNAKGKRIGLAFPPCDGLTSSGARHFAGKALADPMFQQTAVRRATLAAETFERHGFAYFIENPKGRLSTLWRKPDHYWDPNDFGGYLPENDTHPEWPEYIAPRDAYPKGSGAWLGGGFVWPEKKPVPPEILERVTASGRTIRGSRQFMKLGGKSAKTKAIRNASPRGIFRAVFEANGMEAQA
ncbi:hypothetical protein PVV74_17265 [Roseovarius sp. SK2]|uniref:hypothetical protein n=1 Tax=Roseovarius TaxID=74030 RepID=UPI00237A6B10|nr:hypothetical protein [Roseovarius sp. SK2]MDD9727213.1 hypothetical protein [Roseovarius sp. SK2]